MKTLHLGLLSGLALILLSAPAQAKAENFSEISMSAVLSENLPAGIQEISEGPSAAFLPTEKEAEKIISQLTAGKNKKQPGKNKPWNPFTAARLLQTSA